MGGDDSKKGESERDALNTHIIAGVCSHRESYNYADLFKAQGKPPKPKYPEIRLSVSGVPLKVGAPHLCVSHAASWHLPHCVCRTRATKSRA